MVYTCNNQKLSCDVSHDVFVNHIHSSLHYSESTCFTECGEDGKVTLRSDRPFLIISSTSWTGKDMHVCATSMKCLCMYMYII